MKKNQTYIALAMEGDKEIVLTEDENLDIVLKFAEDCVLTKGIKKMRFAQVIATMYLEEDKTNESRI